MSDPKLVEVEFAPKPAIQRANDANHIALDIAGGRAFSTVVPIRKDAGEGDRPDSKAPKEDTFEALLESNQIIEPPFDMLGLSVQHETSSELGQVITAMEVNIDGFDHQLKSFVDDPSKLDPAVQAEIRAEKARLNNFFEACADRDSWVDLRRKLRREIELTGNGYLEVVRSLNGAICGFELLPSYQVRIAPIDKVPTRVEVPILEEQPDGTRQLTYRIVHRRMRRYVAMSAVAIRANFSSAAYSSTGLCWFKEFGDPRTFDNQTGKEVTADQLVNWNGSGQPMPDSRKANEMLHFAIYASRTPYGLPRYIGNLLAIAGDRMSEETNYITFQNNQMPSAFLLVSNGQVTSASVERIRAFLESQVQGRRNYARIVIVEAEGTAEGEDPGQAKMELKAANQAQHKDALFVEYSKGNQDRIRRAYRIAPLFVGRADEYTRATAESSRILTDEQVFQPERESFDAVINRRLFPAMGVKHHYFRSNTPKTTDKSQIVSMLATAEKTGGLTPRIARNAMEVVLGEELPAFKDDVRLDPDMPFSLAMAEAVKNKGDPTEPGQQLTALKTLGILGDDGTMPSADASTAEGMETMAKLLRVRDQLNKALSAAESADTGEL